LRVFAQSHVSQIEQPADFEVVRSSRQVLFEIFDGLRRAFSAPVLRGAAEREDAGLGVVIVDAIFQLAATHLSHAQNLIHGNFVAREFRMSGGEASDQIVGRFKMPDGFRHLAAIGVQLAQFVAQLRQLDFKLAAVASLRECVQITLRGENRAPLGLALRVADGAKVERIRHFEKSADLDAP